jgi:hypothetical protein
MNNSPLLTVSSGTTLTFTQPLDIRWMPKEDITVYELAQCMPLLLTMSNRAIMPYMVNPSETWMRHFKIV